jgi:hypothetical protein
MNQGIASLHKILKDESRQQILLNLGEKGNQTYSDLMTSQGFTSTGKFNYHLKILNGLVSKNQDGLYYLTEKGRLAIRLLEEFGEKKNDPQQDAFVPRGFYIFSGLFLTFMLNLFFGLYVIKIDLYQVSPYAFAVSGVIFLIIGERARRRKTMSRSENLRLAVKITAIFAGVFAGWVIVYYTGTWLFDSEYWLLPNLVIGLILGGSIGGSIGYLSYKRSKFSKPIHYTPFS